MCHKVITADQGQPYAYDPDVEEGSYGKRAQRNYDFLNLLWHPKTGKAFREDWIKCAYDYSQHDLKLKLKDSVLQLDLLDDADVHVVLLDLESGQMVYRNPRPTAKHYILMLPATPQKRPGCQSYKVAQQWDEAWHHAVRETGGM